jgi:chaperonin cofactor prefoldin
MANRSIAHQKAIEKAQNELMDELSRSNEQLITAVNRLEEQVKISNDRIRVRAETIRFIIITGTSD